MATAQAFSSVESFDQNFEFGDGVLGLIENGMPPFVSHLDGSATTTRSQFETALHSDVPNAELNKLVNRYKLVGQNESDCIVTSAIEDQLLKTGNFANALLRIISPARGKMSIIAAHEGTLYAACDARGLSELSVGVASTGGFVIASTRKAMTAFGVQQFETLAPGRVAAVDGSSCIISGGGLPIRQLS